MDTHRHRQECLAAMAASLKGQLFAAGYEQPHVRPFEGFMSEYGVAVCGEGEFGNERLGDGDHCSFNVCKKYSKKCKENCGWPMVWKVVKDNVNTPGHYEGGWGSSCGNSCNMYFRYPPVCWCCGQAFDRSPESAKRWWDVMSGRIW